MRLLGMYEVRRTADSRKGESGAKPEAEQSIAAPGALFSGWRRNVRKHDMVNQGYLFWCWKERSRSQSPHSSDEASNDRGAKEDRKVEARGKQNCNTNCRECLRLSKAEIRSRAADQRLVGNPRKRKSMEAEDLRLRSRTLG